MKWKYCYSITFTLLVLLCMQAYGTTIKRKSRLTRNADLEDLLAVESKIDLIPEEATHLGNAQEQALLKQPEKKYSARYSENKIKVTTEVHYGARTTPRNSTQHVLDFRINDKNETVLENNGRKRKIKYIRRPQNSNNDMKVAENSNGKRKKETDSKKDDDDEKTLSQQVADGKYGLIQNEIFPNGSKRPGILSYLPNPEVPSDNKETLGGLERDEIWLAEDHVLVLKGGIFSENTKKDWPPIDNYEAPPRQVKIPKRPNIPPPFPVQLSDNGPLEFVKGANGTGGPSLFPKFPPIGTFPPPGGLPFPGQGFPVPSPNGSFPYPPPPGFIPPPNLTNFPPNGPLPSLPPFLANLPPGAAFLPPPGNLTEFDEDDPSIYYPPPYDFYYARDNTTEVPPGPLVPGIILPPPPNFFAPFRNDTENKIYKEEVPYQAPVYLPVPRKPTIKYRPYKRPYTTVAPLEDISNQIKDSTRPDIQTTTQTTQSNVHLVYPEKSQLDNNKQTDEETIFFTSPINVPSTVSVYHPLPTTSPKPNHITLPKSETLKKKLPQEIYVVTKERPSRKNYTTKYDTHPLRTLVKPNVTISYVGKYGHLPADTNKTRQNEPMRGHYVTTAPRIVYNQNDNENEIVSVSPVPVKISTTEVSPENPSKATFYFYEEPREPSKIAETPLPGILQTNDKIIRDFVTPKPPPTKPSQSTLGATPTPATLSYYPTVTSKTPIRQFLEETFHASNVLPNKPQTSHFILPSAFEPGFPREVVPKTKLNYAGASVPVTKPPKVKYHYVTETPKPPVDPLSVLEIENAGSSGLQTPHVSPPTYTTTSNPIKTDQYSIKKPHLSTIDFRYTTPKPDDGPFIPSNYYATANPQDLYLTPQDHTLVDDITKNYFTIFGQKIHSTTPITPIALTHPELQNHIYSQVQSSTSIRPERPKSVQYQTIRRPSKVLKTNPTDKTKRPQSQSHFEQYLKEITGEDQSDYIELMTLRSKKPKTGHKSNNYNPVSVYLSPPQPPSKIPQYLLELSSANRQHNSKYKYIQPDYNPSYSTTSRPTSIEIEPQYIQHISSTARPIISSTYRPNHDYRQFLHEVTSYPSPTTLRPIRIKNPQYVHYSRPETKPISLKGDILVNYQAQRPPINPDAELISNTPASAVEQNNFRVVDPPDLSGQAPKRLHYTGPRPTRPNKLVDVPMNPTAAKHFFQNLPHSGYFNPVDHSYGNSFISYNLPGTGGHFYFLTPQAVDRSDDSGNDNHYSVAKRSDKQDNTRSSSVISQQQHSEQYPTHSYTNQDYLRRRRKKTQNENA